MLTFFSDSSIWGQQLQHLAAFNPTPFHQDFYEDNPVWPKRCYHSFWCDLKLRQSVSDQMLPPFNASSSGVFLSNLAETTLQGVFHPSVSFKENRMILDYHNDLLMEVFDFLAYLQEKVTGMATGVHFPSYLKAGFYLGFKFALGELPTLLQPINATLADSNLMTPREHASRQIFHIHYKAFLENGTYCSQCYTNNIMNLLYFSIQRILACFQRKLSKIRHLIWQLFLKCFSFEI